MIPPYRKLFTFLNQIGRSDRFCKKKCTGSLDVDYMYVVHVYSSKNHIIGEEKRKEEFYNSRGFETQKKGQVLGMQIFYNVFISRIVSESNI